MVGLQLSQGELFFLVVLLEFLQLLGQGVDFFAQLVFLLVEKPVLVLLVELVLFFVFFHPRQQAVVLESDPLSFGLGSGVFLVELLQLLL